MNQEEAAQKLISVAAQLRNLTERYKQQQLSRGVIIHTNTIQIAELKKQIEQQAETTAAPPKHTIVEIHGGKHDGMMFDSESGDPTERELVKIIQTSTAFVVVAKVETETEAWIQLRCKQSD
jgi:hypothetical protein